ncbi:ral guanine nucleotide dissociation stimulator-like [Urocitellus parryii]
MSSTLLQLHSAVTFQETVTSLIRRALDQNLLQHEDVDNFELLYMMSEDEKIKVSDHALVCLSMNLGIQYFIVRKRPQVKGKEFSESTCKSSRPLSHKQVGDTCLIRVHLETQSPEMAKSVLVTCQDRAPVVIRSALDLHFLTEENPEDYELGQIISRRQKLRIPAEANVFYAKNAHKKSNFVLRKRSLSQKNDGGPSND